MMGAAPSSAPAKCDLAARIEAARQRGVEHYDGLRFRFVLHLAERADATGSERIQSRAQARLNALEEDFASAQVRVRELLDGLHARFHGDARVAAELEALEARFEQGALRDVERMAVRVRPRGQVLAHASRLEAQVVRRSTLPPPPAGDALALAERLYGERSGEAFTRRAVEELRVDLPDREDAGPYHGTTVAADALAELDARARPLLRAWLQRLRNLDAVALISAEPDDA